MAQFKKVYTSKEVKVMRAKEQILELCINAYEEGKQHQANSSFPIGGMCSFNQTKTYKIISNLKSINDRITFKRK